MIAVKKCVALLIVIAMIVMLLSGCGILLVEDSQPVEIGMETVDRTLTERC